MSGGVYTHMKNAYTPSIADIHMYVCSNQNSYYFWMYEADKLLDCHYGGRHAPLIPHFSSVALDDSIQM